MTEQEQTPLPSSASQQTPDPRPVTGSRAPLILSSLTLLLLCGALFGGYLYNNWLSQQQNERQHQLELQLAQLQGAQPALQENAQQLQQALRNLSDNQQQLRDKQEQTEKQLLQLQSRRPNDWLLAEADYLVRMAGRKLWLERDANAAVLLLTEADNRLRDLNDASVLPLRQAIAADSAKLKELPLIDREGIVLRLGALIDNVDQLTLIGITPVAKSAPADEESDSVSDEVSDWRGNLLKSWHAFAENFITIRRRDGNTEALLSPQQNWYLKENLKTRLLQAQLAVFREQQGVYEDNLHKAASWISAYFDPEDGTTQYMQSELEKLSSQQLVADYPKKFGAQEKLENLVHERLQHLGSQ